MRSYNESMAVPHIITTSAGVRPPAARRHVGDRAGDHVIDAGTVLLGAALSVLATLLTVVLATFGEVSQWSLVVSVAAIGFVTSWARSGRSHRHRPAIVTITHH